MLSNVASYILNVFFRSNSILHFSLSSFPNVLLFLSGSSTWYTHVHTFAFYGGISGDILRLKLASQMLIHCTRSEKHSKWHCSANEKRIYNHGRIIKYNIIIKVRATANAINNNTWIVRLRSFRQVTWLPRCVDRLSDGYLEYASEWPYSVQNMANIRIRLIFDSSNTLVNRLGPNIDNTFFIHIA